MEVSRETSCSSSVPTEKLTVGQSVSVSEIPTQQSEQEIVLNEVDNVEETAYFFSLKKKWWILTVVALCQTSMNYNAAVYSSAISHLNEHYGLDANNIVTSARGGMAWFLITYGFGCELWAPWSEEYGRKIIMQLSLFTVNAWQVLAGASTNWPSVLIARILGGFCSAGGSVTLGMVADMYDADEQQFAVLWVSLWSCLGSVIGGICGGPIEHYLPWRWNFWIQLIFGAAVQAVHYFTVPETRSTVMLNKLAKQKRKADPACNIRGPTEGKKISWREVGKIMWRPYHMLIFEPIVTWLSLLSGFSDALIFSFLESYGFVFKQWGPNPTQLGIAMFALFIGYWAAWGSYLPVIRRHNQKRAAGQDLSPETRLWWLLFVVLGLPLGLLGSAFTVGGPPLPWIAPLVFAVFIGWSNMAVYYATIDYMVAAYGAKYSASATGGNGFSRDVLAGACSFYTKAMYMKLGARGATFLLFGLAAALCVPVYIFYWKGPQIRAASNYAKKIEEENVRSAAIKERIAARRRALQQNEEGA